MRTAAAITFDLPTLYNTQMTATEARWMFAAFALAFAIKVPMWPVHTWLPDAHTNAPTAGSVILAGVMLKMGTYGFLRFAIPLFPAVAIEATPLFMALAVVGIIYGALVAMVQPDLKRLIAYSSVSHLGFVVLGIFALNLEGIDGAVYQMLNHGISTGALFLLVGMIYLRRHTREISEYGGSGIACRSTPRCSCSRCCRRSDCPASTDSSANFSSCSAATCSRGPRWHSRSPASSSARSTCCGPTSA